jgi:hypothetical protein
MWALMAQQRPDFHGRGSLVLITRGVRWRRWPLPQGDVWN